MTLTQCLNNAVANNDITLIGKKILTITAIDIAKKQKEKEDIEYQLYDLRRQYKIVYALNYPNRTADLERIIEKGRALRAKLDGNTDTIREDSNVRKIAGMLVWVSQQLNVYANLNKDQIPFLASDLLESYGALTYEEVAFVLKQGVRGEWGEVNNRLDTQVIHTWFKKYIEQKKATAMAAQDSKNASYKGALRQRESDYKPRSRSLDDMKLTIALEAQTKAYNAQLAQKL
jgi:hypothetical protein